MRPSESLTSQNNSGQVFPFGGSDTSRDWLQRRKEIEQLMRTLHTYQAEAVKNLKQSLINEYGDPRSNAEQLLAMPIPARPDKSGVLYELNPVGDWHQYGLLKISYSFSQAGYHATGRTELHIAVQCKLPTYVESFSFARGTDSEAIKARYEEIYIKAIKNFLKKIDTRGW